MEDMVITLQGTAEQLIQRLVAQGAFPSAESAVSSLLLRSAVMFPTIGENSSRLPDEPVAFDEQFDIPDFPHSGEAKVVEARLANLPRLPDPIFD
jgi:hypothetical protein